MCDKPPTGIRKSAQRNGTQASKRSRKPKKVDPSTCNRDYSTDELEYILAMQEYISRTGRKFPSWSEAFSVLLKLGYRKVGAPT